MTQPCVSGLVGNNNGTAVLHTADAMPRLLAVESSPPGSVSFDPQTNPGDADLSAPLSFGVTTPPGKTYMIVNVETSGAQVASCGGRLFSISAFVDVQQASSAPANHTWLPVWGLGASVDNSPTPENLGQTDVQEPLLQSDVSLSSTGVGGPLFSGATDVWITAKISLHVDGWDTSAPPTADVKLETHYPALTVRVWSLQVA